MLFFVSIRRNALEQWVSFVSVVEEAQTRFGQYTVATPTRVQSYKSATASSAVVWSNYAHSFNLLLSTSTSSAAYELELQF